MRIHKPTLLLLCAIISCSGCATQSYQRSAPRSRPISTGIQPTPDAGPSPSIEYHADPPAAPRQPVPSPPVAETEELEVKGVGLSRVLHDAFGKPGCTDGPCADEPCVDESCVDESCVSEPCVDHACSDHSCAETADSCAEACDSSGHCGEPAACFRLPKVRMPKVRFPTVRMPKIRLPKYKFPTCRLPKCNLSRFCSTGCAEPAVDGCNDDPCAEACITDEPCGEQSCAEGCSQKTDCPVPSFFDKCFRCFKPKAECGEGCVDGCGAVAAANESLETIPAEEILPMEDPFAPVPEAPVPEIPLTPAPATPAPMPETELTPQPQPPAQPPQPPVNELGAGINDKPVLAPMAPMPVTGQFVEPQIWPRLKYQPGQPHVQGRPASWHGGAATTWQLR
ncbi:MAG: hypothetical protein NXI04_11620 [Planctomycetaceae bacterium]|nr:hypothetical protein [Planctomycetaceae bacterium]